MGEQPCWPTRFRKLRDHFTGAGGEVAPACPACRVEGCADIVASPRRQKSLAVVDCVDDGDASALRCRRCRVGGEESGQQFRGRRQRWSVVGGALIGEQHPGMPIPRR